MPGWGETSTVPDDVEAQVNMFQLWPGSMVGPWITRVVKTTEGEFSEDEGNGTYQGTTENPMKESCIVGWKASLGRWNRQGNNPPCKLG
jgi:hypothetical protein